jgi:quinol monooxygenase YgiN
VHALLVSAIALSTWALAGSQDGGAAPRPISVVAFVKAKAGEEDRLKTLALALVAPSRAEKGNVSYDLHQGIDDKTTFVFYENWASMDAFNLHKESPHFQHFLTATKDWLDGDLKVTLLTKLSEPAAK